MKYNRIVILTFIIFIIGVSFVNYFVLYDERNVAENVDRKYKLEHDGFRIFKNVLDNNEIELITNQCLNKDYKTVKMRLLNNDKLKNLCMSATSNEYKLQDYIWIIQQSAVHTCHRDNNGDFFNENQKYPSYTLLIYLENMDKCLGVIPGSHKSIYSNLINITDPIDNLLCKKGDAILFNANLIHVGTLNKKDDNLRIQLKLTHKDDIQHILYYENFNKVLNKPNTNPLYLRKIQKRLTCMLPGLSNLTQQENIRTARGSDNGVEIGLPQQVFSYLFYGNKDFYNLPNAF